MVSKVVVLAVIVSLLAHAVAHLLEEEYDRDRDKKHEDEIKEGDEGNDESQNTNDSKDGDEDKDEDNPLYEKGKKKKKLSSSSSQEKEKKKNPGCKVNEEIYDHGEILSHPKTKCIKYICLKGDLEVHKEACQHKDQCIKINSQFEKDCFTYGCEKTTKDGINYYSVVIKRVRCKDSKGTCYEEGEHFKDTIHNVSYKKCTCGINGNTTRVACRKG
ncbi:uncharacterized protein LOC131953188 isoform X3 [Physella acuta]|uniref:uncharacterized protein LOC131953188 isoform X2 n=1 Tax=Physella acuta TaxID=109671 RepID=UPI0027DAD884|nr:uncharacterized protein LOC131953188 isoform X2 [Physella acuta]XP_059172240.1 uncharacterized protein LOC131953188 isoform X3 [Physella acuta]